MARQHDRLELQVVADLADGLVLEERPQPFERGRGVHLRGCGRARPAGRRSVSLFSCPSGT